MGHDGGAVGEGQHADLGPGEELLDHNLAAGVPEGPVLHAGHGRRPPPPPGSGHSTPLPRARAVGLDHHGEGGGFQVRQGPVRVVKDLILGGGDVIFLHQVLGKDLAALRSGRPLASGPKQGMPAAWSRSTRPRARGSSGATTAKSTAWALAKSTMASDVLGPDLRYADGVGGDAAVAGQRRRSVSTAGSSSVF